MEHAPKSNTEYAHSAETEPSAPVVPPQYRGMHPDAIEIAWIVPTYSDPKKTEAELTRRDEVLTYLRAQDATPVPDDADVEIETADNSEEMNTGFERFLEQPNVSATQESLETVLTETKTLDKDKIKSLLYTMLTKRSWLFTELQNRGSDDLTWMIETYKPHREWYQNAIAQMETQLTQAGVKTASNPAWFSMTASERLPGQPEGSHYKVYETLHLSDYGKIPRIPSLVEKLQTIGTKTGESIKLKIPGNFIGFITHNDSIVIHCDSAETCVKVQQALAEWKTEEELTPTERELGRATIALDGKTEASDGENESFSQLVASQVTAWVEEHKDSYPAKIIAAEAVKHTISLAHRTPHISQ